jgi:hypothetical protein
MQATFVMESGAMGLCLGSMFDVTLPGSLGTLVHQDCYRDYYRKKNSHPRNDAMKTQTP